MQNTSLPVNLDGVLASVGIEHIKVPDVPFLATLHHVAVDIWHAEINAKLTGPAYRMVLAHMLAAVILKSVPMNEAQQFFEGDFNLSSMSQDALQRNKLALSLLIPESFVIVAIKQGHSSIAALSNLFEVSEVAMLNRLKHLKLV